MEQYLQYRSQQVVIGKHSSRMSTMDRGVPQGSILGPLLYLIYTNEIADTINETHCKNEIHLDKSRLFGTNCTKCGTLVTFADDLTLIISDRNRNQNQLRMNINLARLKGFLNNNELAVNTDKTAILEMMIKQKQGRTQGDPPHLIVENKEKPGELIKISDSKCFRILGSNLQSNITWKMHLESGKKAILPAIRKQLGKLKQLGKQLPSHTRKTLAEGLLLSKFVYLISQWGGGHPTTMSPLLRDYRTRLQDG